MFKKIIFTLFFVFLIQQNHSLLSMEEDDQAIVRIWKPTGFGPYGNYGHVSLETQKYYMSFWPKNKGMLSNPHEGNLMLSLLEDEKAEEKACDLQYVLSTKTLKGDFSPRKINNEFERLLQHNEINWNDIKNNKNIVLNRSKWCTVGTLIKNDFYDYSQSCISFVINLLIQGGCFDYMLNERSGGGDSLIIDTLFPTQCIKKPIQMRINEFIDILGGRLNQRENCVIS